MNKKTKISLLTGTVALFIIASGAFALFSDSTEQTQDGIAGTVDMDVSDIQFENSTNLNPGDNDPSLPDTPDRPEGTSHRITFSVENIGTKSIRTRHEITISLEDPTLDVTVFKLYDKENNEVVKKYYEINGEFIDQEAYDALEEKPICTAIKYLVASDIFDGTGGTLPEIEDESTVKAGENDEVKANYVYQFAMSQDATDEYQGKKVNINVTVSAIQYRNTDASGWYTLSSQDISGDIG